MQNIKNKTFVDNNKGMSALILVGMVSMVSAASIVYITTQQASVAQFFFNQKMLNERQDVMQRAVTNLSRKQVCTAFLSGKFAELDTNKKLSLVKSKSDPDASARIALLGGLNQDRMSVSVEIAEIPANELGSDIDYLEYPEQKTYSKKYKVNFNYQAEVDVNGKVKMGVGERFFNSLIKPKQKSLKGDVHYYLITNAPYNGASAKDGQRRPNEGDCYLQAEVTYPDGSKSKPLEKICQAAGAHFDGFRCSLQALNVEDGVPTESLTNAFNLSEALCDTEAKALMRQNPKFISINRKRKEPQLVKKNFSGECNKRDTWIYSNKCNSLKGTFTAGYSRRRHEWFNCDYNVTEIIEVTDNTNPDRDYGMTMLCQKPRWAGCVDTDGALRMAGESWKEMSAEMEKRDLRAAVEKEVMQAQKVKVLRLLPSTRADRVEGLDMIDMSLNQESTAASDFQQGQSTATKINEKLGIIKDVKFSDNNGGGTEAGKFNVLDKAKQQMVLALDKSSSMEELKKNLLYGSGLLVLQTTGEVMPMPQEMKNILDRNVDPTKAKQELEQWAKGQGKKLDDYLFGPATAATTAGTSTSGIPKITLPVIGSSNNNDSGVTTSAYVPPPEIKASPLPSVDLDTVLASGQKTEADMVVSMGISQRNDPLFKDLPKVPAQAQSRTDSDLLNYISNIPNNVANWLNTNTQVNRTPGSTTTMTATTSDGRQITVERIADDPKILDQLAENTLRAQAEAKMRAAEILKQREGK